MNTLRFRSDRGDARLRLDQVLVRRLRGVRHLSRANAQAWIEAGAVSVDGRTARRSASRVREGAEIIVTLPATVVLRERPQAEASPLDLVYEDAVLLAVNKPPGVVAHPTYKQSAGTLLNAILWHTRDRPALRPGIVTRLDKHTSGLVVVALHGDAHAALQRDAAAGRVRKEYLTLVRGVPEPARGRIVLPLARDPLDRRRVIVSSAGMYSETHYEVIASGRFEPPHAPGERGHTADAEYSRGALALVRCELKTGRTHQVRVHLASCGWPILADATYGEPHTALRRQALHAWRVTLPHPVTRTPIQLIAPLPDDMCRVVRATMPGSDTQTVCP